MPIEVRFDDTPVGMEEVAEDLFERRTPDERIVGFAVVNDGKHGRQRMTLPLAVTAVAA